jgi:ATP-dependent RNA helicase DDX51/DBP6
VCAPTGSGKTLAYALPLVHALLAEVARLPGGDRGPPGEGPSKQPGKAGAAPSARRPPRLGALVVVPTRDLAAQVHGVVAGLCEAARAGLTAALITGARPPGEEAVSLAGGGAATSAHPPLDYPWPPGGGGTTTSSLPRPADAVVATPGRLAAHLAALGPAAATQSLRGLRLLVVDEADRLLRQEYGGWAGVLAAALPPPGVPTLGGAGPRTVRLAASATLTRDPTRLAALGLWRPRYLAASAARPGARYALPPGLVDWRVDVPGAGGSANKPAALVALLRQVGGGGGGGVAVRALRTPASTSPSSPPPPSLGPALIFASSVSTASSVAAFLGALDPPLLGGPVALLARGVAPVQRAAALAAFSAGRLSALVASDGAARGLDFPPPPATTSIVVISYDPPHHAKALVHRAGRAARAGAAGAAFTLLTGPEAAPFKKVRAKVAGGGVGRDWVLPSKGGEWTEAKEQARAAVVRAQGRVGRGGGGGV